MYWDKVVVVFVGFLLVIFCILLKSCNVLIVEVMEVNKIIGFKFGIVILINCCYLEVLLIDVVL